VKQYSADVHTEIHAEKYKYCLTPAVHVHMRLGTNLLSHLWALLREEDTAVWCSYMVVYYTMGKQ